MLRLFSQGVLLAGSETLPKDDVESDDDGNYGNDTGRNRKGYGVWDDEEDEEEEDY